MTESQHTNLYMPVKRLKNIITAQREVEDIEKVKIFFLAQVKLTSFFVGATLK